MAVSVDWAPPASTGARSRWPAPWIPCISPLALGALKDPVGVNVGNPHAVFFVPDAEASISRPRPGAGTPCAVSRAGQHRGRARSRPIAFACGCGSAASASRAPAEPVRAPRWWRRRAADSPTARRDRSRRRQSGDRVVGRQPCPHDRTGCHQLRGEIDPSLVTA